MSETDGWGRAVADPAELWRQWFETSSRAWSGVFEVGRENVADPYGLYRQWFAGLEELRNRMVSGPQLKAPGGTSGMEGASPVEQARPVAAVNPLANAGLEGTQNLWRQWFEAVGEGTRRNMRFGAEMAQNFWPRWIEMLEQVRNNLSSLENIPTDPLQFTTQWYNATSGPYSDLVSDLIEREEFLEQGSRFLQNYASFYKVFKRNSEEYLKNLQLPVRSDITRVAGLVVALEDKLDNLEETVEDLDTTDAMASLDRRMVSLEDKLDAVAVTAGDGATADSITGLEGRMASLEGKLDAASATAGQGATADSITGLEQRIAGLEEKLGDGATASSVANLGGRLDGVEEKLDRLLAALDNSPQNGASALAEPALTDAPQEPLQPNGTAAEAGGAEPEIRATAAARRKAGELDVDLARVKGTGAGGQITVDDVRKMGES